MDGLASTAGESNAAAPPAELATGRALRGLAGWLLAARLARRELRSGLGGFRLFLACLALGVAAIAAIGSFSRAIQEGLRADARQILGGDVALSLAYRNASPEQLAWIAAGGTRVGAFDELRTMARTDAAGARPALIQLKAVSDLYPLYGGMALAGGGRLSDALAMRDGVVGAVVEEIALRRLGVEVGGRIRVGDLTVEIRDVIAREPDRGLNAFGIGPRVMIPLSAMEKTGLVQPGSLLSHEYRIALPDGANAERWIADLKARFPDAGWRIRGLEQAGGGIRVWTERLTTFLSLIGLASLLVGGVGVGNAVEAFLHGRRRTIATLKCMGAPASLVSRLYLIQLGLLAAVGVAIGLAVGAALPFLADAALANVLPVRARIALYAAPLAQAALFGGLTALMFALWPLARARATPAAALMRGGALEGDSARPRKLDIAPVMLVAALLATLAVWFSPDKRIGSWFVIGAWGAFAAFPLLARGLMWTVARLPRPRSAALRLAIANLHRPGAPTPAVMLSLGLGLTVLVATALIEGNLQNQITKRIPKEAPAFFLVDVQPNQIADLEAAVAAVPGSGRLDKVPSLRGRIVKIGGKPVSEVKVPINARWAVDGDRGLTYAATLPEGSRIVAGQWWPADYKGPPLISFDAELAAAFGLGVGDTISVEVLGREIEAKIANLRRIDWTTLAINFTFVFAPGALERAPQTYLATVHAKGPAEEPVYRAIVDRFTNVTVVRVKDALEQASFILENIGLAARIVGTVSIAASVLVLAGAMLATQRRRVHEAVVMKALGADRSRIVGVYALEFAALGLLTALAAAAIGSIAAWTVIRQVMNLEWTFLPWVAFAAAFGATVLTLAFGLAGTIAALRQRPLDLLRNE